MAVRLSALLASSALPPERSSGTHFVRGLVNPRAIVWLEGIGKLKKKKEKSLA
jgi:hypothetical protein